MVRTVIWGTVLLILALWGHLLLRRTQSRAFLDFGAGDRKIGVSSPKTTAAKSLLRDSGRPPDI